MYLTHGKPVSLVKRVIQSIWLEQSEATKMAYSILACFKMADKIDLSGFN
jgi:hypothetical protein